MDVKGMSSMLWDEVDDEDDIKELESELKDFMLLRKKQLPNSQNIQYLIQEKDKKGSEPFEVILHDVSGSDPLSGEVDCKLKVVDSGGEKYVEAMCLDGIYLIKRA